MSSTHHELPDRRSVLLLAGYGLWLLISRALSLSLVVYFLTRQGRSASFEEINEAFSNHQIIFAGASSALFLIFMRGIAPLLGREQELNFSWREMRTDYLPAFFQGFVLATSMVAAFLLLGTYRFVGFFVQIEDSFLAVLGIAARMGALLAIALCEESIFRSDKMSTPFNPIRILLIAVIYCVVKLAQFDLSWMHFATLFLFSVSLSVRRMTERSFLGCAGFWSALLIAFQPVFSLPVFGSDFSGLIMLKYQYQPMLGRLASHLNPMISGGAGGPLSSIGLQLILLIEIVRGLILYKKSLLKPSLSL